MGVVVALPTGWTHVHVIRRVHPSTIVVQITIQCVETEAWVAAMANVASKVSELIFSLDLFIVSHAL